MRKSIDINCDLGEQEVFDPGFLHKILPYISSANISCGAHAGTKEVIEGTIKLAKQYNIAIGAHPSYPDKENFGRISAEMNQDDFRNMLKSQIDYFSALCKNASATITHIKPHGALYNDLADNEELSMWFIDWISTNHPDIKIFGLAESIFEKIATAHGLDFVREGFMDRKYTSDLRLMSRKISGAVIKQTDQIIQQIDQLLNGKLIIESVETPIQVDTICIHGDTKGVEEKLEAIFNHLKNRGIEISAH